MNYDVAIFQEMTGINLSESQLSDYERAYNRAVKFLSEELGWDFSYLVDEQTYDYETGYIELGKTLSECTCPKQIKNMDSLLPPDVVQGEVRIFPFSKDDSFILIDPCYAIYTLKLVVPLTGDEMKYVTVKELENIMPNILPNRRGEYKDIIHYVERCDSWPKRICGCDCINCVMLAVDGKWCKDIPKQLFDILTQLILYFMKNPFSISEDSRLIKSESVDGHSVSYGDKSELDMLTESKNYLTLIRKFMGPYSPYNKKVHVS